MTVEIDVGTHALQPASVENDSHSARRWTSVIATALLMVIAVLLVGSAALVYVFHPRFDTVLTGSMRPGIQPGDVVMVRAVPTGELKVGDVIAYVPPAHTTPVLHRIVSIDSSGLLTKGDANNVADPWGKVSTDSATTLRLVWVIPKVGLIAHNRSTVFIGAGALFIAAIALTVLTHKRAGKGDGPHPDEPLTMRDFPSEGGKALPNGAEDNETWSQTATRNDRISAEPANISSPAESGGTPHVSGTTSTLTTTTER